VLDLIARTRPILHSTTPPQSAVSFVAVPFQRTPWSFNRGSFADISDLRKDVDSFLRTLAGEDVVRTMEDDDGGG
jgi:hypothetical protein